MRYITVYICLRCGAYYGANHIEKEDWSQMWNYDLKNRPTFTRDTCPDCGAKRVKRQAFIVGDLEPEDQQVPAITGVDS